MVQGKPEEDTEALIIAYDQAKIIYDEALWDAYGPSGEKWPEEKRKLWARNKVRQAGLKDPDTYRWLIRMKLGSILE